jgi:hypothetical protein
MTVYVMEAAVGTPNARIAMAIKRSINEKLRILVIRSRLYF